MSHLLDREVVNDHALVVDPQATTRSVMVQHLRSFGFAQVRSLARLAEARELLEQRNHYRLVVCEHHFGDERGTGQELLEELRREQLLPPSTVFVMVTSQATYPQVAEAAEAALDSYLIKPFSAASLFERLKAARQRKRVLKDVFEALEARDHKLAAQLCLQRFQQRAQYANLAARLGAEMLLHLGQWDTAFDVYRQAQQLKPAPWARLGMARARLAAGDLTASRRLLEELKTDQPHYADLYDVLGRLQLEQGHLTEALATYRTAAALTPGCLLRQQHCGTLAFLQGEHALATDCLERAVQMGLHSRLFDALSLMMLAFLRHDQGDCKALTLLVDHQRRFAHLYPHSQRLHRMAELGGILLDLGEGRGDVARSRLAQAASAAARPELDFEGALNLLGVQARLARCGFDPAEAPLVDLARQLGERFCVSRASTEMLCAATAGADLAVAAIREAHAGVTQQAESALNQALNGEPTRAVQALLQLGARNGNAKLIEMAAQVTRRHQERLADADVLQAQADALLHRWGRAAPHLAGLRRSQRAAGGLLLRQGAALPRKARPAANPIVAVGSG